MVEQDTWEEVAQCVQTLLTTTEGDRIELPTYGIPSPVFSTISSTDASELQARIAQWEPRAQAFVDISIDALDELVEHIRVRLLDIPGDPGQGVAPLYEAEPTDDGDDESFGIGGFGMGSWGE